MEVPRWPPSHVEAAGFGLRFWRGCAAGAAFTCWAFAFALACAAEHFVFAAVGAIVRLAGGKKAAVQFVEFGFCSQELVL